MNAKEYLEQIWTVNRTIRSLLAEIETLKELSLSSGAIRYDNDRVIGSAPQSAHFENSVVRLVDLQDEIRADIDERLLLHEEIRKVVAQIEDEDVRAVIRMRYLAEKSLEEISDSLKLNKRTILRRLEVGYHEVSLITGYPEPPKRQQAVERHDQSRKLLRAWKEEEDE